MKPPTVTLDYVELVARAGRLKPLPARATLVLVAWATQSQRGERPKRCVLAETSGLSEPTVSRALRDLRRAAIV